ncbi:SagB/ThcOx family dehydrogenase [Patescibacteria group bacterium]|nr:SagB/ThcOx family dehydrogenase [Patescibacteria group bacterium]MBU2035914.1 SagB/ThcOx family dehydrogenase [Patescibacteria group bacterium]
MKNINIVKVSRKNSISKTFYQKTKIKKFPKGETLIKDWPNSWKKIYTKDYPRLESIQLPKNIPPLNTSISTILLKRKSERIFFRKKVSLSKLSTLLFYSAGIIPGSKTWNVTRRFYPSAGARYPLEVYLSTNNIVGLENGLYHYNIRCHSLDVLLQERHLNKKISELTNQDWVSKSNIIILITSAFQRTQTKYDDRGLRHILLESGHLAQNVYLVGNTLDLKVCAIGGFIDDKINNLIDIDNEEEGIIYVLAVGT